MKKRLILFLFTMLTTVAKADWSLSSDGVLTVTSDYSYEYQSFYPWYYSRSDIKSVVIADGVTSIGEGAFYGYSGLTSVEIPSSVTSIGLAAFSCSGLTSVEIPSSVTSIGNYAFYSCSGLTSVEISSSVTSIGDNAFTYCFGLTSVEIPSSVTSIGEAAFHCCSGLTLVEIPSSVTSIGSDAFSFCSGLKSIIVNAENKVYDSRDNCNAIIERTTNTLIVGCANTTIPSSVTSIGGGAFEHCIGLTSVEIPSSVTSIGNDAFLGCSGLTSVEIPAGVTSIGSEAFYGCSGLTSVTFNNAVPLSLEWGVFYVYNDSYVVSPNLKIYVPKDAVDTYKEAWSEYADIIFAIPTPTAVESIDAEKSQKVIKTIEDGKIVIIRDGVKYDVSGKKIDMK
ncbi:MAG: leucine-rich repeat domain-containing protein [Bacteroidales bacterium]|nr:leucine-rich repeat domain-containing protein [Bacteroidales bacterium]